jgi:hypothetical protein
VNALKSEDIVAIGQLLALYGHAVDATDQSLLPQVFTEDATFDPREMGAPLSEGLPAICAFFEMNKAYAAPSHNTTNIHVYEAEGQTRARSKWFSLNPMDGALALGDYDDLVVPTPEGWRIRRRRIVLRHPKPD